jgi:hypothetical protein
MWNPKTKSYKFHLVKKQQAHAGIPVYGGEVGVLVKNDPSQAVVRVISGAKSLVGVEAVARVAALGVKTPLDAQSLAQAVQRSQKDFSGRPLPNASDKITRVGQPSTVIWAGARGQDAPPRLARVVEAEGPQGKWRFVVDAESGKVLEQESLIVFEAVAGQVQGAATQGSGAAECGEEVSVPLPYALVSTGKGKQVFADEEGRFSVSVPAGAPVSLESLHRGGFFSVYDQNVERDEVLKTTLTPPGSVNFTHNASNDSDAVRAQTNAYVASNEVRAWILERHPDFPLLATQTGFPVNVNLTSGYCPGNAWYDQRSINFCEAGGGYGNTAFASVVHHEYGHHVVNSAGSGQGAYGEGMSDAIAMLIADDSHLGLGFYQAECERPLRDAVNDCQYDADSCSSCGSEVHDCGKLLAGAVWDVRQALALSQPETYLEVLSSLIVNSTLLHRGVNVDAQIPIDLLTLDDDDGNILRGTPHRTEICAGFEKHGIECPPLLTGIRMTADAHFAPSGDAGGPFRDAVGRYVLRNHEATPLPYRLDVDVPWLTVLAPTGVIPPNSEVEVAVVLSDAAQTLAEGEYEAQISLTNVADHVGDSSTSMKLRVGGVIPRYDWSMDEDPGWTTEGDWAFGVPQGQGGDPREGATGSNVLGFNLGGTYTDNMPAYALTSRPIDCSAFTQVKLAFQRWLGIESSRYDQASVEVSTDGSTWVPVWRHDGSSFQDTKWLRQEIDISSVADRQPAVYVRWVIGPTDGSVKYSGWNLDDVEILGARQACEVAAECDNGNFCDGTEVCQRGRCFAGEPASAACADATPLARYQHSGNVGSAERWFVVTEEIAGWSASELGARELRVNGVLVTPGQMPLPPKVGGRYYFQFGAGEPSWSSLIWW